MAHRPELLRKVQRAIRRLQSIEHELKAMTPREKTPDLNGHLDWTNKILNDITGELKNQRGK